MGDVSKLPKWAQQRIENLERSASEWKARATVGPEDSDTFISRWPAENSTPLGTGPTIRMQMGPEWWEYVDLRKQADRVYIFANQGIKILPMASNSIKVGLNRRG